MADVKPIRDVKVYYTQIDVDRAVNSAQAAFASNSEWRKMDASARGKLMFKLADLMERDRLILASLETMDCGKTFTDSYDDDMPMSIELYRYFGGFADKITGKTIPVDGPFHCYTRHEPVGVCGLIVPWNFPIFMASTKIAPAMATGCTIILKPAEQSPLTALHFAALVREAGFPPGVFNVLPGYGPTAGAALTAHMGVNKVSFTGSTDVGKMVMRAAADSNLKRVTLELGGKSPLIVCADADMEVALETAHFALFFNMGEVCTSGSRIFVQDEIHDEFVRRSVEMAMARKIGDPFDEGVESGPIIDQEQMDKIIKYIEIGKKEGAKLECGGKRIDSKGFFVESTVFSGVTDDMRIAKEEFSSKEGLDRAIERCNATSYGLSAGICTRNIETYLRFAERVQAGTVWVNTFHFAHRQAPFGGFKMSGFGREYGEYGLAPYTEVKTVYVKNPHKIS